MLADAIRSEAYRFSKNRTAVLWSTLFVPVVGLVITILGQIFLKERIGEIADARLPPGMLQGGPLDLGQALPGLAGGLAHPMLLLFVLVGVATLYAGDYRWETWRLTTARNTRPNLLLGKVGVAKGLILVAMMVMLAAGVLGEFAKAAIFDRALTFTFDGGDAGQVAAMFGLSLVRIVQFTMLGLLAAVMTRSLLAALFVPLVVTVGQFFLMQSLPLMGLEPTDWRAQLAIPGLAFDTLKALVEGGPGAATATDGVVWKAAISLALWTLAPLAAAIAWFQRQDLSKE